MADVKSNGNANELGSSTSGKKPTIEKTYQKKTQLEHILLRPDTYIGSVQKVSELMWVYDSTEDKMVQKQIEYVPGLYKIFDEILVNAADNKQRDRSMDCIKIEIKQEENLISIWNNGRGIPVVMHKEEKIYVPTMIFGHLLTSSNYNDEEQKVTGGRNGYGAKLCNIFSTKFVVETSSSEYMKEFKQTWASNMTKTSEPKVFPSKGNDFTKITFSPDLAKFQMDKLDDDIIGLLYRRAFDVAASTRGVKVFLNGKKLGVKNFKDYIELYIKGKEDDSGNGLKVIHEVVNDRWEVALTLSEKGFQQVSFVNSIATTKGGRHVDYVADMIVKQLIEVLKKKNKGGVQIKPFQVKNHMWIFINCLIVNPTFDSQTKETMTLQAKNFGSKCPLSEKFISSVTKSGIVESVLSWAKFKAQNQLDRATSGKKTSKLKGIPKLEDANDAGTANALKCTLILTEGDSAKSTVVSGLGVVGRDHYGIFPLRGKILNTREATHKQILENQEINNIIKILGLQYKKKYNTPADMATLRYGKVMIMTDQDQDGSHIKGLLINFIHHNWPELLKQGFIEQFITPIVKARKKNECISFYSLPELEEWKANTPNHNTYNIKYYKGLGTSDAREGREYFSNMDRHRIAFKYSGPQDDDHILLAFSKKKVEHRKEWLTNFMVESRRRKELGLPEKYLYSKGTKSITYTDFINMELILFSNGDNVRSIPSMVDGLKPGQRKIMYVAIKRNDKREIKVSQLVGSVIEKAAYHHGDTALSGTIVGLAQNFVGSNNINLLEPRGQFGTRLVGGKDNASPRYIFTKLSPLSRMIFHPDDDPLLKHEFDDNIKIEPQWYIPILPMILVNGADGIGTGWMTKIPNYNPRDIVKCIRQLLNDEEPNELIPWYKNFRGTIQEAGDNRYVVSGEIANLPNGKLEITELPVGTWTTPYKENIMEAMMHGTEKIKAVIKDYKDYSTDITVKFVVSVTEDNLANLEKEGLHKSFKLQTLLNTSSMCAFDEYGCLKRFDTVMDLLKEFYKLRLKMYDERKSYLTGMLQAEADKLSAQAKFIVEKCNGELVVENKKRKTIVDELIKKNYPPDPVAMWKLKNKSEEEEEEQADEPEDDQEDKPNVPKKEKVHPDVKKFDYLLGMSMWMLTEERKNELLNQKEKKLTELSIIKKKSPADLWREDLDIFMENLDKYEQKEKDAMEKELLQRQTVVPGKRKPKINETMPSTNAVRIAPFVTDDIKKKIQSAIRAKQNVGKKKVKKENVVEDDEFDIMVKDISPLKEKLKSPEEKKKIKMKQPKITSMISTLNGSPKGKGRKKKKGGLSDEEEDDSDSDVSFTASSPVEILPEKSRTTNRRAATKVVNYDIQSDDDDDDDVNDDVNDDDQELFDNNAIKETTHIREIISSDEENDAPPPPLNKSSEDMFDTLVGRKKDESKDEEESVESKKRKSYLSDHSDLDDSFDKLPKKSKPKKKKIESDDESFEKPVEISKAPAKKTKATDKGDKEPAKKKTKAASGEEGSKAKGAGKKAKPRKKKVSDSEDDDFEISASKKTKGKKKKGSDSEDDDFNIGTGLAETLKLPPREGRNAAKSKYVFSDESD